jgi:hypothetical protein
MREFADKMFQDNNVQYLGTAALFLVIYPSYGEFHGSKCEDDLMNFIFKC